jgi:hypothetical protein
MVYLLWWVCGWNGRTQLGRDIIMAQRTEDKRERVFPPAGTNSTRSSDSIMGLSDSIQPHLRGGYARPGCLPVAALKIGEPSYIVEIYRDSSMSWLGCFILAKFDDQGQAGDDIVGRKCRLEGHLGKFLPLSFPAIK